MRKNKSVYKFLFRIVTILIIGFLNLSMTDNFYKLLTNEDWQEQGADEAALSSPSNSIEVWESFNMWHCFSTENIQLEATEIDYGASALPTIRVQDGHYLYDFSLDFEEGLDWKKTLSIWQSLLANEQSFCVYSAYLQELPDDAYLDRGVRQWGLWIVNKIKTSKGYWNWYPTEIQSNL